jgi:SAM-dependent methyltransferase
MDKELKQDFVLNFEHFIKYWRNLLGDIYAQPQDSGHTDLAEAFLAWVFLHIEMENVLDVGCGQGVCEPFLRGQIIPWTGVTIGEDFEVCQDLGLNVHRMDMSFLDFEDESFNTILVRHALEHSPYPIMTLMEWHRVSSKYLILVFPAPDYWGYGGKNHYSVMNKEQLWWAFKRSGWKVLEEGKVDTTSPLFMNHYRPEVKDRASVKFHKATQDVEWWYILEKTEEIKE